MGSRKKKTQIQHTRPSLRYSTKGFDQIRIRPHLLVAHGGFRGGAAEDHPPLHRKLASVLALLPLKQKSTE